MKVPVIDSIPFKLYLDLDGVFADFDGRVKLLTGKNPHELGKDLWKIISRDKEFFASLELMKDAEYLWEYCKQYNPTFLTGAPSSQRMRDQKQEWTADKFGVYDTIVLPKRDKLLYSGWKKVLVDDTQENIHAWVQKGGVGIHHRDVWETIEALEQTRAVYQNS